MTDAVILPRNGCEVSIRTHAGTVHFAWTGDAGEEMAAAMLQAVTRAAYGGDHD